MPSFILDLPFGQRFIKNKYDIEFWQHFGECDNE